MATVEILYFEGCPHYPEAERTVRAILVEENLPHTVVMVNVKSREDAVSKKFLGSPTVRVEGGDVVPEQRDNFGLQCRMYMVDGKVSGVPPRSAIHAALLMRRPQ